MRFMLTLFGAAPIDSGTDTQPLFHIFMLPKLFSSLSRRVVLLLAAVGAVSVSCKKDKELAELGPKPAPTISQDASIPCYQFDWETATYMPSAQSPNYNPIQMPWNSGASAIDPNIIADYKKVDGWELMYNTFTPTTALNDGGYRYFFALYNRYRGQLRFYVWKSSDPLATSYVAHGLKVYGSQKSNMLDFNAQDIVRLADNPGPNSGQQDFSLVLKQQIAATGGTWFVMQYEMSYDPNLTSTYFPSTGLQFNSTWVSVSQIKLNGTQTGDIKGYLGSTTPPDFSAGDFFGSFFQKGVLTFLGVSGSQNLAILAGTGTSGSYAAAMKKAGTGLVEDFFSGLIGGLTGSSSTAPQPITLTMNTKIDLSGTLTTSGSLLEMKLALPGQVNSQTADGNTPASTKTMGVFTLANTPTVRMESDSYSTGPWEDPQYGSSYYENYMEDRYYLNANTVVPVWNSAVINSNPDGAHIENLKKEIVIYNIYTPGYGGVSSSPSPQCNCGGSTNYVLIPTGHGNTEFVGQLTAVVSDQSIPLIADYAVNFAGGFGENVAVRVSFDVVPNSGAPRSKLVKTFYAKVTH